MKYAITKWQIWLLTCIANKIVIQSADHKNNIITFYSVLVKAARRQFTEDNAATLDCFLTECHAKSLKRNGYYGSRYT